MSQDEILSYLLKRRATDGAVFHSKKDIAKATGIYPDHVTRQIKKLYKFGYVERYKSLFGDYRYRIKDEYIEKLKVFLIDD